MTSRNSMRLTVTTTLAALCVFASVTARAQTPSVEVVNGHNASAHEVVIMFSTAPSNTLLQYLSSALDADQLKQVSHVTPGTLWRMHSRSLDIPTLLASLATYI